MFIISVYFILFLYVLRQIKRCYEDIFAKKSDQKMLYHTCADCYFEGRNYTILWKIFSVNLHAKNIIYTQKG